MKTDPRFSDTNYLDWTNLVGRRIVSVNTDFGDNCVVLNTVNDRGDTARFVVDTEAVGFGLVTPVLAPVSQYSKHEAYDPTPERVS